MEQDFSAPEPGLAHAFDMRVERGPPVEVGLIATGGRRRQVPVTGGSFVGGGLAGTLVGGAETLLERADGVTMVEASYYIAFAGGAVARCFGNGYLTRRDGFAGTRLALLFEAEEGGPVAELATRAFLAEQPEGAAVTTILRIT